jgi:hypothetical protein
MTPLHVAYGTNAKTAKKIASVRWRSYKCALAYKPEPRLSYRVENIGGSARTIRDAINERNVASRRRNSRQSGSRCNKGARQAF